MNGWPVTQYQLKQVKWALAITAIAITTVLVLGNIIAVFVVKQVVVDPQGYTIREGFPFFTSGPDYIRFLKSYPHDPGTKLKFHTVQQGESFWDIARRYNVNVDTLIAANPFLNSMQAAEGIEIAVPLEIGVLVPCDSFIDALRMKRILGYKGPILGSYMHSPFRLFSMDDMRLAFFKGAQPYLVSQKLQMLYNIRRNYQHPLTEGLYSSLFGDRVAPYHTQMEFHNGVDIQSRMGAPIYPIREGIVSYTGWLDGYGRTIKIIHPDGYESMYGHCLAIKAKQGDMVSRDQVIALVGSTGLSTGPHVHFMMTRHGKVLNPLLFIW
jgi:murein DD-endopeptidase MepM/ murein hydrolase activator NlpD